MSRLLILALLAVGCDGSTDTDAAGPETDETDTTSAELSWPALACDPIVDFCGFPFPNNVFTVADANTPTGRRLALAAEAMPETATRQVIDPSVFNVADGFSPGGPLLADLPGAVGDGLNGPDDVGASLDDGALTVIIDTTTGERVPHWAELDHLLGADDDRTFTLQPAVRLHDATRYVVAIRGVVDAEGTVLEPTDAFRAFRDGTGSPDRQPVMDDIFGHLEQAGWSRDQVQLTWDFTTRSKEDLTRWLVHMRDDALATVGEDGPAFTIDDVQTGAEAGWDDGHIAFRVRGTFEAPLYLDQPDPPAHLVFGDDGLPEQNGTMDVPFEVLIPTSAVSDGPKSLLMYGHGLFGEKEQIESGHFRSFIDDYGYVMFGIDLIGMAWDDGEWLQSFQTPLITGRIDEATVFHDRLHQGFLNHVLLMRLMKTGFAEHETYGEYIDPSEAYYHGISQGGIMGVVHAALSQDFERAALGVMGQPYAVLLPRSVDFEPFFDILKNSLESGQDVHLGLALVQQTWSRVEPDGWSAYIDDPVDDATPAKQVFMRDAVGDHQVTTWGAHTLARTLGATHVPTGVREIWGLPTAASVTSGHALVEYAFGLPEVPPCNVPMSLCDDPHGEVRHLEAAREQLDAFLRTGEVTSVCEGACIFTELSGCVDASDADAEALCE